VNGKLLNLKALDLRVMVPAKNFDVSKEFYEAIGCIVRDVSTELALVEIADRRFYLQNYYVKDWAENFVLYVVIEDANAWYEHVSAVIASNRFVGARARPPRRENYGAIVTYLIDPSGVLIHLAQVHTTQPLPQDSVP
jgi:hypothetical protein